MSLEVAFHDVANKSSRSSLIGGLVRTGYDMLNMKDNAFVACLAQPEAEEVIIINIETETAPKFYNLCARTPDNNFFPKIYEMDVQKGFSAVRMEKLIALDHASIDAVDAAFLEEEAPKYIRYIRGESTSQEIAELETTSPHLKSTVQSILKVSQDVYRDSNGATLPFCDQKIDNIFLRKTPNGKELVFGDPLFPGTGKGREENWEMMENAYKRFGLPSLKPEKILKIDLIPA